MIPNKAPPGNNSHIHVIHTFKNSGIGWMCLELYKPIIYHFLTSLSMCSDRAFRLSLKSVILCQLFYNHTIKDTGYCYTARRRHCYFACKFADGWRHISPTLNFKYCSKLVIGRCLAKSTMIGWRKYYGGGGGCRQTPVWSPANTRFWPNVVSILAHGQPRWTNIETTSGQVLVFAGRTVGIWIHACRLCLVGLHDKSLTLLPSKIMKTPYSVIYI